MLSTRYNFVLCREGLYAKSLKFTPEAMRGGVEQSMIDLKVRSCMNNDNLEKWSKNYVGKHVLNYDATVKEISRQYYTKLEAFFPKTWVAC